MASDRLGRLVVAPDLSLPGHPEVFVAGDQACFSHGRAIVEIGRLRFDGFPAWLAWLMVHIYYLIGFENRLSVTMRWAWSFCNFRRGARLIVGKEWRFYRPRNQRENPDQSCR